MTPEDISANPFAVTLMGARARRALTDGGGRVLAVFRRSFYVEMAGGGLACLGPAALGAGPLNALCHLPGIGDWGDGGLAAGQPARSGAGILDVGGRARFAFGGAATWRPEPPPAGVPPADLPGRLRRACRGRVPDEGLGRLITTPEFLGNAGGASRPGDPVPDPVLAKALPAVASLKAWLVQNDCCPPPSQAAVLVGLGPGLTPSGDDLLGGALVALHAFGQTAMAGRLAAWALPLAATRTGTISRAHLAAAAGGTGSAALHAALTALRSSCSPQLDTALAALDGIGHTSGWDALAGVALVGEALFGRP